MLHQSAPEQPSTAVPTVTFDSLRTAAGVNEGEEFLAAERIAQQRTDALRIAANASSLAEAKQLVGPSIAEKLGLRDNSFYRNQWGAPASNGGFNSTSRAGQQGTGNDMKVDGPSPLLVSAKEQPTDRSEPSQTNGSIPLVSPEKDRNPGQHSPVQGKTAEPDRGVDKAIAEVLKQWQNGERDSVPPSISLQKFGQSGALARLTALHARDARGSAPESPSLETRQVNLVERGREPVIAQRPAANSIGTLFRAEPTGPQGLVGRSAGVSLGERVSRQVPVESGVAINLSDGVSSVPKEKDNSLSVA
jgi:hypothetical protein